MREILFRGKRVDNGEWVYGFIIKSPFDKYYIYVQVDKRHTNWKHEPLIEVIPETIGQYTGLTDKNGNKIFEGDILKCYLNGKYQKIEVSYNYGAFSTEYKENNLTISDYLYKVLNSYFNRDYEVIGNIFDKEVNND